MVPMTKLLNVHFAGSELMTGLPEYRNGGLFVDTGLLTLKDEDTKRGIDAFHKNCKIKGSPSMEVVPLFTVDDDVIVEWRAVTVGLLDELLKEVNIGLNLKGTQALNLAQMLEAGSWKVRVISPAHVRDWSTDPVILGRPRTCRGLKTEHQGTAHYDSVRRHSLLRGIASF
jgi:hypothetical protein